MDALQTAGAKDSACPRCGQTLIDPTGLGWCKACGYCRSLGEDKAADVPAAPVANGMPAAPTPPAAAPAESPIYLWITLANVVFLAGAAFAIGRFVPLQPLERALWTTIQIGAGLMVMFIGQFVGVLRLAPANPSLSFKDCFVPFQLYELVFKNLPGARWTLYLGSWGLTLVLSALICVGGLNHWFTYLPSNQNKGGYHPSGR